MNSRNCLHKENNANYKFLSQFIFQFACGLFYNHGRIYSCYCSFRTRYNSDLWYIRVNKRIMVSKTQQKKSRKRDVKTYWQLAKLHRQQADCHRMLAEFYEIKAKELKHAK